jgi:crotonobetainyl-CoA:carnitine CoA-transferase CaiB-like acyl-CoA transferase
VNAVAPLAGVRVLDLTRYIPGPLCTALLADMGADVVKVEEPPLGDPVRAVPPARGGESTLHAALNRSKRSLLIDLRQAAGAGLVRRLAGRSDVLVEGFRPGVLAARGLGPDRLLAENPRLVFCSISGWGGQGPLAGRAGHDLNYLARGGVLAGLRGTGAERPTIPLAQLADSAGALAAALGVLAALLARDRSGRGQVVEISLLDAALALNATALARLENGVPARELSGSFACYNVYRCGDGAWVALGALEPKFWEAACRGLGLEEAIPQQWSRGAKREALVERFAAAFASRTRAEWLAAFEPLDACLEPVLEPGEALDQARAELVEMPCGDATVRVPALPFRLAGVPQRPAPAPGPGQHTDAVLGELGLAAGEIAELRAAGAVA